MAISRETLRRLRALATAVGGEVDDAVRTLTAAWVRAWDELEPAWRAAVTEAVTVAAATGQWPAPWQLYRIQAIAQAAQRTEMALTALGAEAGITTPAAAATVVAAAAEAEPWIIASQLPTTMAADAASVYAARILPTALDLIVARTREQITAQTRPLGRDADEAVRRALIRGVAVGANPNAVARDMLARVEGAFNGGLSRAIVIARSEMLDAYREASRYTHTANADVLSGWRWLADLGRRTCPACWAMHGTTHSVAEPGPSGHPQCRCARAPVTKTWRELGINLDEPADAMPNAKERFAALPDADQAAVMGRSRLVLLRSGAIDFDDLAERRDNPGWRPSYNPRPVRALRRLADRRGTQGTVT